MAPDSERRQESFPRLKYPLLRDTVTKTTGEWLKSKELQDGAEGLWRIHDKLYDLSSFVDTHPGGKEWISLTKGTDITEVFETHHLKGIAEQLIPKYYVKDVTSPRNSPFTFAEDGFYKTLKAKVMKQLPELPPDARKKSDSITDCLLAALFLMSPVCCWLLNSNLPLALGLAAATGAILNAVVICAHNYFHRSDSWRMYLFNLGGLNYNDWRVSHAMSHHMHTNTIQDMEIAVLEPFLHYLPRKNKPIWAQMGAFYYPIIFAMSGFVLLIKELVLSLFGVEGMKLRWSNGIPFLLPTWMWLFGGQPLLWTLGLWAFMMLVYSFLFVLVGLTAGHHSHINFFEGDIPRDEYLDWGLHQLDTIVEGMERSGVGNHVMSITSFGDHSLHHLFPTIDHGHLQYLYPIFFEHCKKYDTRLRMSTFYEALLSKSKQLIRKHPNNFRNKKNW